MNSPKLDWWYYQRIESGKPHIWSAKLEKELYLEAQIKLQKAQKIDINSTWQLILEIFVNFFSISYLHVPDHYHFSIIIMAFLQNPYRHFRNLSFSCHSQFVVLPHLLWLSLLYVLDVPHTNHFISEVLRTRWYHFSTKRLIRSPQPLNVGVRIRFQKVRIKLKIFLPISFFLRGTFISRSG